MLAQIGFDRRGTSSPSERQLVLLSAGTAARRDAMCGEARRLAGAVDWTRLARTLRARRLLATLGPRILEFAEGHASAEFAVEVAYSVDSGRRRGAFLQLLAERTLAELGGAGIRAAPLKGPILSEAIYGDIGRRWSGDVDLLVPASQLPSAVEVVRAFGYSAPGDYVDDSGLPRLHLSLEHTHDRLPPVELHWRVHWYETRFAPERLLPPTTPAPHGWRPAPADELVALLLFYARDGFIDLRLATDIGAWWDTFGTELAPGALGGVACDYPALQRVLTAAAVAAERVVGLPPAPRLIGDGQRTSLRCRAAIRLANPHPHSSLPQLHADKSLIDGLLTPAGGLAAFVRRELLPPREVLHQRARLTQSRRGTTRFGNGARVLIRYVLALIHLARPSKEVELLSGT